MALASVMRRNGLTGESVAHMADVELRTVERWLQACHESEPSVKALRNTPWLCALYCRELADLLDEREAA